MKKSGCKRALNNALRLLPVIACIAFIVVYLLNRDSVTAEGILSYAPGKPLLAAAFLTLLYAAKSLTIVFPIAILHVVGGVLFPPLTAIAVNVTGVAVDLLIPYWIGRISGRSAADKILEKHPSVAEIVAAQQGNSFFISFFVRVIYCLPGDIVSIYLGAVKLPFSRFLIGGLLGALPNVISITLIGASLSDPSSPGFWISVGVTAAITVVSGLGYLFWRRKRKK